MVALNELPWQIKVDGFGYPSIYGTNEDGGVGDLVAHTFADHEHLIAAAPAMLEALCAALLEHDAGGITLAASREMRAAIAKARGEAS